MPRQTRSLSGSARGLALGCLAVGVAVLASSDRAPAAGAQLPEIRLSAANPVPACATPERLMAFLKTRNGRLDPRFGDIAKVYKFYGEKWQVRWDYAFFQMAIETNFLTYRRPDGRMGDVDPAQNNFAGIGTTGGGVPGNRFPNVETGVLAQIQHLVVYSGERIASPVAPRTQLKQDDILEVSLRLGRPVRFSDLARRWAADKNYGSSIEWAAQSFRSTYCRGGDSAQPAVSPREQETLPWLSPKKPNASSAPARSGEVVAEAAPKPTPATKPPVLAAAVDVPRPVAALRSGWAGSGKTDAGEAQDPPSKLGASFDATSPCQIRAASYGGRKTLLIRTSAPDTIEYTALTVLEGFETSMAENYIKSRNGQAETVAEFPTKDEALTKARELCPAG